MRYFLRHYPLTTLLVAVIWVICLIPIPETPLSDVSMIDKWTHIVMYFVLSSVVGFEYVRSNKKATPAQLLLWEWLLPVLMGGLVEIVQATCTNGVRSGDWLDFLADGIGSTLALVIGILLVKFRAKA